MIVVGGARSILNVVDLEVGTGELLYICIIHINDKTFL